ncbi:MAG: tRNA uridine-5-carboxymethylaminomethyl(34) synthesis GTPase MnmE [Bacteroidales bacterium]|nr:tRNA uridine-5-carboxymethylaminomethyl(34) synthesis GTPase MnmE [Bacteroidales bacterium]
MNDGSTICAVATPQGNGAIAIIRLSGIDAFAICDKIYFSKGKKVVNQKANTIHHGFIKKDNKIIDEVLVYLFKAPNSYTGENVVEISCHGSIFIQQQIIQLLTENGAKLAKPGEFTLRAFLNGKMDLSQAEAVADLIASTGKASHQVAIKQMRGGFSEELKKLRDQLLEFTSLIELELDFSEEDVEFADRKELNNLLLKIYSLVNRLKDSFSMGNVIKNGVPVVIIGKTNVGKSTLLNALLMEDKAIVSEIAGTTRDAIEDVITLEGIQFRFIDTAGLRETLDTIENLGIKKTYEKISQAKIILILFEAIEPVKEIEKIINQIEEKIDSVNQKIILIINKIDKIEDKVLKEKVNHINHHINYKNISVIPLAAKPRINLDKLEKELLHIINLDKINEDQVIINNARHYEALQKSAAALERAKEGLKTGLSGDLLAQDIREVMHYLGEITGEITTDEILGNIFSKFCIGK